MKQLQRDRHHIVSISAPLNIIKVSGGYFEMASVLWTCPIGKSKRRKRVGEKKGDVV